MSEPLVLDGQGDQFLPQVCAIVRLFISVTALT
jgi:hypothetical protein